MHLAFALIKKNQPRTTLITMAVVSTIVGNSWFIPLVFVHR
jgi:hypothetical protein